MDKKNLRELECFTHKGIVYQARKGDAICADCSFLDMDCSNLEIPNCGSYIFVELDDNQASFLNNEVASKAVVVPHWLGELIDNATKEQEQYGVGASINKLAIMSEVLELGYSRLTREGIELDVLTQAIDKGYDITHRKVFGYKHTVIEWTCPDCKTQSHDYEGDRYGICPSCLTEFELEY